MTTAPADVSKAGLWDYMRDESMRFWELNGNTWPASPADEFEEHVAEFARKVMQDGTARITAAREYTTISGTVNPRWCLDDEGQANTSFVIRHSPLRGEVVILETSVLLAVLNTNARPAMRV